MYVIKHMEGSKGFSDEIKDNSPKALDEAFKLFRKYDEAGFAVALYNLM